MAQTEKSVMLRLRNNESRIADPLDPTQHASWQTTLKTPVTLEEGDQVKIHTCILDTSAESIIQLDDPAGVDISIGVMKYITFYQNYLSGSDGTDPTISIKPKFTTPVPSPNPGNIPVPGSNQIPDVRRYFACLKSGSIAGAYYVNTVTLIPEHQGFDECGDCVLQFAYTSGLTNQPSVYKLIVPPFHPISHENGLTLAVNCLVKGNSGWDDFAPIDTDKQFTDHKLQRPSNALDKKLKQVNITYSGAVPTGTKTSQPYIEQMDFNIPTGRYTPGEIATLINDKMSDLEFQGPSINEPSLVPPQFCVNNPFLSTVRQLEYNATQFAGGPYDVVYYPEVGAATNEKGDLVDLVDKEMIIDSTAFAANVTTGGNGAIPNNRDDLFIGAEQVDLNFDPVLKKLNFSIMHFPIYVGYEINSTPAVPGVQYNADGKLATTFGGAAIASLDPPEFWQKQLGFTTIVTPFQNQQTPFNTGDNKVGDPVFPVQIAPIVGTNITGIFKGLDIPVAKTDRFFAPEAAPSSAIESSLTTAIIANREFDSSAKDEGYFLIEIGFKFPQTMIGGQYGGNLTNNNIQSVIGKYYTGSNNFLQDTGAGSIVYEHRGDPELLTDLNVRVLLPDGTLPSNTELGPKNSVFLEIIKTEAVELPQPPTPEKK